MDNYLESYYRDYDEDARLESRWGRVEYLTTMDCVHRYMRPGMRVMEIGADTGLYSHALAREGYQVDAVELLEHHIAQFRERTQPGERVTITQAEYRLSTGQLTLAASTSDETSPPVLTAHTANGTLIGNLSGNGAVKTLSTTLSPIPPAKVQVTSANGGSDSEDVVLVP